MCLCAVYIDLRLFVQILSDATLREKYNVEVRVCVCLCVFVCLSFCLCVCPCVRVSVYVDLRSVMQILSDATLREKYNVAVRVCVCLCVFVCMSFCLSMCQCVCVRCMLTAFACADSLRCYATREVQSGGGCLCVFVCVCVYVFLSVCVSVCLCAVYVDLRSRVQILSDATLREKYNVEVMIPREGGFRTYVSRPDSSNSGAPPPQQPQAGQQGQGQSRAPSPQPPAPSGYEAFRSVICVSPVPTGCFFRVCDLLICLHGDTTRGDGRHTDHSTRGHNP